MQKQDVKFVIGIFLLWRFILFVFLFFSISLFSLQKDFLGGGLINYLKAPYLWSWINFDGEHYLSIAYQGYRSLQYFYFPFYPLVIRFLGNLTGYGFTDMALIGLIISNLSLLIGLLGLMKLLQLDFDKKQTKIIIILLMLFPTSFYFTGFYTESLFLTLVVWSFYFARKGKWLQSFLFASFASATKVIGVTMLPVLLAEYLWGSKKVGDFIRQPSKIRPIKLSLKFILIVPLGLIIYMFYLFKTTGDPLEFFHSIDIFGQQRSESLILLPQVFYRYVFKILPNLDYSYFPVVFSTWLELFIALIFLLLIGLSFLILRLSYAIFFTLAFIIPTLSGSFSSLPRYVVVLFPAFITLSVYLNKQRTSVQIIIYLLFFLCLGIATSLFVRGYWIA